VHPILAKPERLAAYLGAWALAAAQIAYVVRGNALSFAEALLLVVPPFMAYAFVCLSAYYVCRAVPLRATGAGRVLVAMLLATAIAGGIWLAMDRLWVALLEQSARFQYLGPRYRQQSASLFAAAELLFLFALAVHYLGLAFEQTREAEERQSAAQVHARDAELRALRAQLDPHFLYNCLNSIAALTSADAAGARRMCLLLGEFLRSTVRVGALARIPLAEELALADRFLAIEQVRFGERLQVERRIDEAALPGRVPPLFLQPLFENAITHGIADMLEGGVIYLDVNKTGERLTIAIDNPCDLDVPPPVRQGTGTGLKNVRQRLSAIFSGDASLTAHTAAGRYRVELNLPFITHD
jgi:two-component system, LytTR family, sensor histidine kinase AlgZ